MVLITFLKPNIVIHSDRLLSGSITVLDKQRHLLWSLNIFNKSFVSIKTEQEWPKEIEVELNTGASRICKEIMI